MYAIDYTLDGEKKGAAVDPSTSTKSSSRTTSGDVVGQRSQRSPV